MKLTKESKRALKIADKFTIQATNAEGHFLIAHLGEAFHYIHEQNEIGGAPAVFPLIEDAICFLHDNRCKADCFFSVQQ
jgi:hypothetical protein